MSVKPFLIGRAQGSAFELRLRLGFNCGGPTPRKEIEKVLVSFLCLNGVFWVGWLKGKATLRNTDRQVHSLKGKGAPPTPLRSPRHTHFLPGDQAQFLLIHHQWVSISRLPMKLFKQTDHILLWESRGPSPSCCYKVCLPQPLLFSATPRGPRCHAVSLAVPAVSLAEYT